MQLLAKKLLEERFARLLARRQKLSTSPGLAIVSVGDDKATATFVRAKQTVAKKLDCQFFLHHFPTASQQQLEAVIEGLNGRRDISGIVLQLPLPDTLNTEALIQKISPIKDIDNLRGDSPYSSPTPSGIIALLRHHKVGPEDQRTVILGAGRLVGEPLGKVFRRNNWPATTIERNAQEQSDTIKKHDILIACTGVPKLVAPAMVHRKMVVVDGSGVDVDVPTIEPLVNAITPPKGAIGPLTVSFLFENLLLATNQKV